MRQSIGKRAALHHGSVAFIRSGYVHKEEPMKRDIADRIMALMFAAVTSVFMLTDIEVAAAQSSDIDEVVSVIGVAPKLQLTPAQRSAIYQAVEKDRSKVAPSQFATNVGAEVPPMIELYALPDAILASNPATKFYKFTRVDDQIVLVDPILMRVTAVIGPRPDE